MNPQLRRQLDALNADLRDLLKELKKYPESDLNRVPKPGAWTVLQVMHHLMLAERGSHQYVVKKLSFDPELKNKSLASRFRILLLDTYLRSPLKYKAPEAIGDKHLPAISSFWEVAKTWEGQREELAAYLAQLPTNYAHKEIYKHPFVGRLTLGQMLRFFQSHFNRHRKQIRRALIFQPNAK
ncbi:MAG: DinB family protein [Bacteroidota bacterium]